MTEELTQVFRGIDASLPDILNRAKECEARAGDDVEVVHAIGALTRAVLCLAKLGLVAVALDHGIEVKPA